jgi:signal transduction histidine kinase
MTVLARDLGESVSAPGATRGTATALPTSALPTSALPSPLSAELRDVLLEMADASRRALGVDRASVLLLDPADRLVPAVSVARTDDKALWARFQQMPPVCLDALPDAWELLRAGEVVAIDDVAASPVVPATLRLAFQLRSLAVAPIFLAGGLGGALVVDHSVVRRFSTADLDTLRGIAAATGASLRRAREYSDALDHSRDLDLVVRVTADLNAARTLPDVVAATLAGLTRLLGATSASVNLLDGDGFRTLAAAGRGQPAPGDHPIPAGRDVERVRHAWTRRPSRPIVFAGTRLGTLATLLGRTVGELDGSAALVPLHGGDDVRGFAVLGCAGAAPDPKRLALARALAEPITRAIDRARETDAVARRLEHAEAMRALVSDLALTPDMSRLLERLAPTVRDLVGAEILDVYLSDERASRLLGTAKPRGELARLITRLRRHPAASLSADGTLLVPMVVDGRVLGAMRLRTLDSRATEPEAMGLLLAIAEELARIVTGAVLRAKIAESARELALADERERIARDLHDTLGQLHFSVGLQLDQLADTTEDESLRDEVVQVRGVVGRANEELRQAIHALSYLHRAAADLPTSLRQLVRGVEAAGIRTRLKISGTPLSLSPAQQEALYRAANEALVNVRRHSRATDVSVLLTFGPTRTTLVIRDNGAGLLTCRDQAPTLHFGVRTMQRRLEEVGGELEIRNVPEGGVRVTAWVATGDAC